MTSVPSRSFTGSWAPSYGQKIIERLERDVFPWLGKTPVANITPPLLLEVLDGVKPGELVVTSGSFFLRAEAGRTRSGG